MTDPLADDRRAALVLAEHAADFLARALALLPEARLAALAPDLSAGHAIAFLAVECTSPLPTIRAGVRYIDGDRAVPLVAFGPDGSPRVEH